jgi:hypothetical protein
MRLSCDCHGRLPICISQGHAHDMSRRARTRSSRTVRLTPPTPSRTTSIRHMIASSLCGSKLRCHGRRRPERHLRRASAPCAPLAHCYGIPAEPLDRAACVLLAEGPRRSLRSSAAESRRQRRTLRIGVGGRGRQSRARLIASIRSPSDGHRLSRWRAGRASG